MVWEAKYGETWLENFRWGGTNYSGIKIGPKWKPGFTKYKYGANSGELMIMYKGDEFKKWNGDALITHFGQS